MGFLGSLVSAVVKVAITPIAIIADAGEVLDGEEPTNTISLLSSAGDDLIDAVDDAI